MFILIRVLLGFVVLFYGTSTFARDSVLNFAEELFKRGNYKEAITEYKRFLFFNPESGSASDVWYRIGLAYRNERKWEESTKALRNSIYTAPNDSIRNEREIALGIVFIAMKNYSAAEFQLLRIESFSPFQNIRSKAAYFRGVASLYSFKWENARDAFQIYFEENSFEEKEIDSLLAEALNTGYKSPSLAKWMSTFIPGTGQIYAGDVRDGLNALAINGGAGYLLVDNIIDGNYANAFITYLLLFQRFYFGNRSNAQSIAEDHNERLRRQRAKFLLDFLAEKSNKE